MIGQKVGEPVVRDALPVEAGRDLSPTDVATMTGLSRSVIYREIARGRLAAYRVGGRLRVEVPAVAAWKAACHVRPRWEPPMYEPITRSRTRVASVGFAETLARIEQGARPG